MIPWFQYTSVSLGPVPIRIWGFFVALGIAVSLVIISKRSRKLKMDSEEAFSLVFWMIIFGLISARLFHILFYEPAYFISRPFDAFKIWQGGLSSYGGFAGAAVGFAWFVKYKKLAKKTFLHYIDLIIFASLYGWIIGRVGCMMIHDHMGRLSKFFLAIQSPGGSRLDMALMEILALIPLAVLFFALRNKKMPNGWFCSVLFVYYGLARFIMDFFRAQDISSADARYLGLTPAQYFSIVLLAVGVWMYRKSKKER